MALGPPRHLPASFKHPAQCVMLPNRPIPYDRKARGGQYRPESAIMKPALHFIAFRGDEYVRAFRIFGRPDFIHQRWDRRAQREIAPGDTVLFARGCDQDEPSRANGPDLLEIEQQ